MKILMLAVLVTLPMLLQTVNGQSLEALDLECRETYHPYCFGDQWESIVTQFGKDVEDEHVGFILEDEFEICSFENECFKKPADDFLDKETIDRIWKIFEENDDTYPKY